MNETQQIRLKTVSITKLIFEYSFPSMLGLIVVSMYETVDRFFIGRYVGSEGLAVMAIGLPFVIFLNFWCLLIRIGGGSALSRSLGEGDNHSAENFLGNTLTLLFGIGLLLGITGVVCAPQIVALCGADGGIMAASSGYVRILAVGAPLLLSSAGAAALIRSAGAPNFALISVLISCFVNIVLDAVFVTVFKWGIPGAAWATVISQGIGAIVCLIYLCSIHATIRLRAHYLKIKTKLIKEIISVGFGSAVFEFDFIIIMILSTNLLTQYGGTQELAAMTIIGSCVSLLFMPLTGIGEGLQPLIGFNYGAGDMGRVKKTALIAIIIGVLVSTAVFLIIQFKPALIISFFSDGDTSFIKLAANCLQLTFLFAPVMAFQLIIPAILSALGDVKNNIILGVGIHFIIQIPVLIILPRYIGVNGIWISYAVADMCTALFGCFALLRVFKKKGVF